MSEYDIDSLIRISDTNALERALARRASQVTYERVLNPFGDDPIIMEYTTPTLDYKEQFLVDMQDLTDRGEGFKTVNPRELSMIENAERVRGLIEEGKI